MKKVWLVLLSSIVLAVSCSKHDGNDKGQGTVDPADDNPGVTGVYLFSKADQFSMPDNVSWAYSFDNENPTFNMAIYCSSNEGTCLNGLIDSGKVVLETKAELKTSEASELELAIHYSGWASKYSANESEFASQPFFSVRLVYTLKNDLGQLEERFQEFVLPMKDISAPTVKDWKGEIKNVVYGSGNTLNVFKVKAPVEAQAENMKIQIYDVGASLLQIQKIEAQM